MSLAALAAAKEQIASAEKASGKASGSSKASAMIGTNQGVAYTRIKLSAIDPNVQRWQARCWPLMVGRLPAWATWPLMAALCYRESGGDPTAVNVDGSTGLWGVLASDHKVNGVWVAAPNPGWDRASRPDHYALLDPETNARWAADIFRQFADGRGNNEPLKTLVAYGGKDTQANRESCEEVLARAREWGWTGATTGGGGVTITDTGSHTPWYVWAGLAGFGLLAARKAGWL